MNFLLKIKHANHFNGKKKRSMRSNKWSLYGIIIGVEALRKIYEFFLIKINWNDSYKAKSNNSKIMIIKKNVNIIIN